MQIMPKNFVDARAITLIGIYAFYAGSFMLLGIATPLLRLKIYSENYWFVAGFVAIAIILLGWLLSGGFSRFLAKSCDANLVLIFSRQFITLVLGFWLSLLLIFSQDFNQVITAGLASGIWAIVATTLLGIALRLGISLGKFRNKFRSEFRIGEKITKNIKNINQLSVLTKDDAQVLISPNILAQQPRQFLGLMCLSLSLFSWTILDLPDAIDELVAIGLGGWGLTSLSIWQVLLDPGKKLISLCFGGIWGMKSCFSLKLAPSARLETIKLKEVDWQWLQFTGTSAVITMPTSIAESISIAEGASFTEGINKKISDKKSINRHLLSKDKHTGDRLAGDQHSDDQLTKISFMIAEKLNLHEHQINLDLQAAMPVILPQGAAMLAGLAMLALAIIFLVFLPMPPKMLLETTILLTGCCMVSPSLGRLILSLVAPTTMNSDLVPPLLPSWQIGAGLIVVAIFARVYDQNLLGLTAVWLCWGVGCCILALSRCSPLIVRKF